MRSPLDEHEKGLEELCRRYHVKKLCLRSETAKLLWDAREACRLVLEFSAGRTFDDYEESALLRSAVERQLEVVGEALRRLSRLDPETAAHIPELESVVGFRNVLAHGQDAVSDRVAWDVVRNDVPALA